MNMRQNSAEAAGMHYEHVRNPGGVPSESSVYGTATFHDTDLFTLR